MFSINYEDKKSVREAFGKKLAEIGAKNSDIVALDSDLAASTQTKIFAKAFPERFFDMGIAEQNMMTTAAGLALEGKIPFAATFATFATGRAYDQIRVSVCYQKANVKIVGTHGGITVGEDGATHQALEDISLMRGLPEMTVIVPSDALETEQAVEYAANHKGAVYLRLSRMSLPDIYPKNYQFNPSKMNILKTGKDITIISNGDVLSEVCKASDLLESRGINAEIISAPVVKPFDSQTLIESAKRTGLVVTVENHSVNGGLGSAVCETLAENYPVKVLRLGLKDCFGQSGTPKELLHFYGLDAEGIVSKVMEIL